MASKAEDQDLGAASGASSVSPSFDLRTRRLVFRSWTESDLDIAEGLWGDPRVTRLIDARRHLTRAQIEQRLAAEIRSEREHGVQYWPIFLLGGNEHVGCCGLRPYASAAYLGRPTEGPVYELGVHLRRAYWGSGLASEAARAVVEYAFATLAAAALFAGHHPENESSQRLLARLGFCYSHDEHYEPTGLEHPSYWLRREEWVARRS